jgi:glycosyltransferase involved in cell wall biosynthesis
LRGGFQLRIALISQYFWPEPFIINDLVLCLSRQGHQVTVLTGKPNYPDGQIYSGYSANGIQEEYFSDAVKVVRIPLRPRGSASSFNLIRNYLSFILSGLCHFPRLIRNQEVDVILVYVPSPITSVIPAIFVKWLKKAHLAVWVQDIWPESLAATGHVRNRLALTLVGWLVNWIYRCTDTLLIQSRAFQASIEKRADPHKIVYYPNSIHRPDHTITTQTRPSEILVQQLDISFSIVFAGNLGKAQSLQTIVEAAKQLQDLPNVRFFFVGSGSMSDWLAEQQSRYNLDNVVIAGRYPMETMPEIYARADALLVTLTATEIFSLTVPSKIQAYLAAGKPIIAAVDGEGARIVREANAGLASPAEDVKSLVESIRQIYAMSAEERAQLGQSGYDYFNRHFEMEAQAKNLVDILTARIDMMKKDNKCAY